LYDKSKHLFIITKCLSLIGPTDHIAKGHRGPADHIATGHRGPTDNIPTFRVQDILAAFGSSLSENDL